jgi:hypothetical protein
MVRRLKRLTLKALCSAARGCRPLSATPGPWKNKAGNPEAGCADRCTSFDERNESFDDEYQRLLIEYEIDFDGRCFQD